MIKKIIIIFLNIFICISFKTVLTYANSTNHILPNNWYREDVANLKKEKVTSITIENADINKTKLKTYWEIDKKGLFAYVDDTDVFIVYPEGDMLFTDTDANRTFSFSTLKQFDDYETGDDNEIIYDVIPKSKEYDEYNKNSVYISDLEAIYNLDFLDVSRTRNFDGFFMGLSKIINIDLSNFQTKSATSFTQMFKGCENLKEIDLEFFDTKNVSDMSMMFEDCKSLKSIDTKNFKTDNLIDMIRMFKGCESLKYININHFDTSNVKNMNSIFMDCKNIENIYIDKIDTKKLSNVESMFKNCSMIKNINIDNLNLNGITECSFMFFNCNSLESINLSNLNLIGKTHCEYMLSDCLNLKKIYISKYIAEKIDRTRLTGEWKNIKTSIVYNFNDIPLKKIPIAGTYINTKFLEGGFNG